MFLESYHFILGLKMFLALWTLLLCLILYIFCLNKLEQTWLFFSLQQKLFHPIGILGNITEADGKCHLFKCIWLQTKPERNRSPSRTVCITKTAQKYPSNVSKSFKVWTWPQNLPDLDLFGHLWDVAVCGCHQYFIWTCLGGFYRSRNTQVNAL